MLNVCDAARKLILIHLLLLFSLSAWASGPVGGALQGTLYSPGGGPVTSSNVTFKIQVLDKSASCVLYEEVHNGVDLSGTNGDFSLNLGSGSSKVNNVDSSSTLKSNIFRNDVNVAASASCPGGVTVAAGDERLIRVMYDVAGGASYSTLSPDMKALGSPYSVVAETLQGKAPSDFIVVNTDATHSLSQANVENIFSNTNYTKLNALLNGTTSVDLNNQRLINVANPTSAQDAATKSYSDTSFGGKTLDMTGVGAASGDKFVMSWDQTAQKWIAGLPNDTTKLPLAGGTMTGPIAMGAQNITNIGHMTMASQRTLGLGSYTNAQEATLIATPLVAGDAGKFWYNSDLGVLKVWNGTAAVTHAYTNVGGQIGGNGQYGTSSLTYNSNSDNTGNDGGFAFQSSGANLMTINNTGDVNIAGGLGVTGSANFSSTVSSAKIGIGTATPSAKLDLYSPIPGTISSSGTTVTGTGTTFLTTFAVGDMIYSYNQGRTVTAIASDTSLTISSAFNPQPASLSYTKVNAKMSGALFLNASGIGANGGNRGPLDLLVLRNDYASPAWNVGSSMRFEYANGAFGGRIGSAWNGGAGADLVFESGLGTVISTMSAGGTFAIGPGYPNAGFDVNNTAYAYSNPLYGTRLRQTLVAQNNNDTVNGLWVDPTYNDNGKTGVTHNSLIVTNGNVGFGTTSPQTPFHVATTARIDGPLYLGGDAIFGSGNAIGGVTNSYLKIQVNSAERIRIDANGLVGIGTSSPTAGAITDFNGSGTASSSVLMPRDTTANRPTTGVNGMLRYNNSLDQFEGYAGGSWVSFASTGGTTGGQVATGAFTFTSNSDSSGADGGFTFKNGATNVVTINNAGDMNVASTTISTNSSTGALVVGGGLGVATQINAGGTITGTALAASKADATPYTATGATDTPAGAQLTVANSSNTDSSGAFTILRARNSNSVVQNAYIGAVSTTGAGFAPSVVIGQQTASGAYTERMRVDPNGYVGIGTTSPTGNLDIFSPTSAILNVSNSSPTANPTSKIQLSNYRFNWGTGDPSFVSYVARGTSAAPAPVTPGMKLLSLQGRGFAEAGYGADRDGASIDFVADTTWGNSTLNSYMTFNTAGGAGWNNVERMRITSAGNVGIGTTTPANALTVNGTIATAPMPTTLPTLNGAITAGATSLAITDATGWPSAGLIYLPSEVIQYSSITGNTLNGLTRGMFGTTAAAHSNGQTAYTFRFLAPGPNSTQIGGLLNLNNGALIVGTGESGGPFGFNSLTVGFNSRASGSYSLANGDGARATGIRTHAQGVGATAAGDNSTATGNTVNASAFAEVVHGQFNKEPAGQSAGSWMAADPLFVLGNGTSVGSLSNAVMIFKNGSALFNGGANVALPTASVALTAMGTTTDSSAASLNATDSTGASNLFVRNDGNVGINTTSPGLKLDVKGSAIFRGPSVGGIDGELVYDTASHAYQYWNAGTSSWQSLTGGTITFTGSTWTPAGGNTSFPGGNVGVGTSNSLNTLDVLGNAAFGTYGGVSAAPANGMIVSGRTGIGTATPSANSMLDVNGAIYINGANGIRYPANDSTAVGSTLAIGVSALANQDGLASAAFKNTAVGYQAIGAGIMTTSAIENTALGNRAMRALTSGNTNTAVGSAALTSLVAGSQNTAIGRNASQGVVNGSYTTSLGYNALQYSSGGNNTAIGATAMGGGVGGSGGSNTALGYSSLGSLSNGASNVALGINTGLVVSTGNSNTIIGPNVGSVTLTTGSSNILIGNSNAVDTPAAATSNFLNIGNAIFATGMTGTLASPAGNVGIGVASPSEKLEIAAGGNVKMGYEIITSSTFTTTGAANCSVGKQVLGGGCNCNNGAGTRMIASYPSTATAWTCVCDAGPGNSAFAICANMK